jgi:LacI family repressor for deo operon, udp, cdd, tsx, nupC, and nupG
MARAQVTIRDVAARAGVSHQTVSRVINASDRVSPHTRARVEAAIEDLGYRPNAIARSMARGRSGALACLAPNLTDHTFASLIEGAQRAALQQGFYLVSVSAPDEETFAVLIEQLVDSRRTEGLLVINPYADGRHEQLPQDVPVVLAGARPRAEAPASVALDDVAAARMATEHVLGLGHRRIGMITGPMREDCSQDRCAGFFAALAAAGLATSETHVVEGDWSPPAGYKGLQEMFARPDPPTAVFAQNDGMAVGVLRAARDMGLLLPAQLSVIGVDDIPMASYFAPPLTTVRQDFAAIGREAANLLIEVIDLPQDPPRHLLLPAELVIRRSTSRLVEMQ